MSASEVIVRRKRKVIGRNLSCSIWLQNELCKEQSSSHSVTISFTNVSSYKKLVHVNEYTAYIEIYKFNVKLFSLRYLLISKTGRK